MSLPITQSLADAQRRQRAERIRRSTRLSHRIDRFGLLLPFALVFGVGVLLAPHFLSLGNIRNVLINASLTAIIGYGMTLAVTLRGLDLSVGSIVGVSGCLCALGVNHVGMFAGIAFGLAAGAVAGLGNGVIIARLRVPAFVATLGTEGALRGVALLMVGGNSIVIADKGFASIATAEVAGLPVVLLIALAFLAGAYLLLEHTPLGRHIAAVGGSPEAAADVGIRSGRITVVTYTIVGLAAGISGVLTASQLVTVDGVLGTGLELQIIVITVLGGTSLIGGSGNMGGTFIAAVLLAMVAAILNLLNIPSFYQGLATGLLLLLALSLDSLRRHVQRNLLLGA